MNNLELSNPVAWTDADELADMDCNTYGNIFNAKYIDIHNGRWLPLYSQGYIDFLIAQLEAAQRDRDLHYRVSEKFRIELIASEAALSAANQPWRSFVTNNDISALNRFAECCDDPESGGHDLDKDQVERLVSIGALRKTKRNYHETTDFGDFVISVGFTVEGEPAPVKYIVILQRAWCNDSGSGINYHSDLIEFDKRDKAIKYGFELQDSDDFNIGVLTNGVLTSFDWMAKPLAETKDSLARIANRIGIEGNADAK
ncbi:TPA: hypothetical protein ACPZQD_001017 [Yersinia enterocolitica]